MNSIEKAIGLIRPISVGHETLDEMHWVTVSDENRELDPDLMDHDGSGESFCEDCIEKAISRTHKEWTESRTELMGRIYESEKHGYFTYYGYAQKDKKFKFRKVKCDKKCISFMKKELRKKYRLGTLFSSESMYLWGGYEDNVFSFCESCGKMFNTNLLLDDQELGHWETLDDDSYTVLANSTAYELLQILDIDEDSEFYDRVMKLAERVCKILEKFEKP